ncbi:DNRLRE domain-containing protein [Neobacillus sp. 19]|uniref:DNRLRE domain-containing protein n=1 Tax=Neobacillus sp. 19 TaxID=3394458 RepID=UPI003BF6530F
MEEIALRKENEKVINNQDGTFTKRIFDQPVHFKKGDKWEEISSDLIEKNGNEYKPKNTELDVSFQKNMKDGQYAQFQQDNHIFSVKLIQADGEQGVIKVQPIVSTVSGNKIWYKQIFPNIDLRNIIFNDSVKEDIVLHQYTGHNQFQFEISTELKPHTKENGSITFVDEQDKEIYILPKPFMSDSNINPESGEAATSENVSYDLKEEEDGKYLLTLIADSEWLKSPERKFPIYIDPTVTNEHYNNFVYAYVSNAYPNNNYSNSKLWDATYEAYVLKVGYYDSTTGDNYAYLKNSLVNLQGAVIKKATLWLYTIWSYSTTPTNVWVSTSKTDWNPSTITWNYSPSVANLGTATAVRNSWFSYDVTTTVQNWANNPSGNFGFSLHTSGNGATYWKKFIAYDNKNRLPEIEITYTFLDKPAKPTVIPYPLATNSSTGYFDLSWSKVEGADYYLIGIWNGKKYDYINVGNVNSWSTKGKKIWPTVAQIEQGRYWLHTESSPSGTDLPNDPNSTYVASQGDWQSSHQYWFVVSACSSISGYCSPNSDWSERYLPDTTAPNQPGQIGVKITDGANNSGSTAKADLSWNSVSDLPTTIGTGIDYYEIQKYTEGSWKPVANVPHLGAAGYSYSVTNLPDSSSNIMFRIKAFDKSKNYSGFSTSSEYVTKDRTKPKTPTDLKINPEKWTNSQEFTLSWEGITDNKQINTIQYSIDDGEWIPLGTNVSTGSKTIKNEALSDGIHEIKVRGIDAEGNYGDSKSVSLKKDTLAPTIVFNYPDNAQTIGGIVDINAKINVDKAPVSYWKLEVGEGESPSTFEIKNSGTELASDNILYSWDTTKLNEQTTYTIKIEVQDEAGNINRVTRKVIKSKNTETINPAINILAPTNQETITKPLYPVEYLIDNVSPNTGDYEANLFVNSKLVNSTGKDKIGLTLDATQYAEGSSNKFYIRGKDSLGNYKFSTTSYQTKGVVDTFEYLENIEKLQGISHAAHSLQLNSTSNGYSLEGSFESKVQPFAGDIQTIYLKPVEQKPAGTDISYFASADGGQTWQSIKPFQTEAFQQVGNSLKVKAILTTTSGNITPILNSWDSDIVYVNTDDTFKVKLIDEPKKLTATPNVNYMTLLRWKASETSGVTYNMYRSTTESFTPSEDTLLAEGIQTSYWNDYNLNYGQKFYYKVVAIKDFNGKKRLSLSSNVAWSKVVDKDELEKRMGLQDYWGYSTLRTGGGDGYINMSSGNLVYQSTDFVAAGPKLGMVMKRSYNSQSTTKTPLGYGWDFSFNTTLLKEYNEAGQEVGLILKDGDGSLHRFGKNKTGTYDSPKGVHMILTRKADGTYEILRKDQIKYVFDINLKLTNFTEPNGNQLTLTYDPDRGNLSSVKNNVGDEIRFTYFSDENLNDHLKYVIDQAGRVYNFRYNDKGHLEQVHQIIENNAEYAETYQYDPSDKLRFINDPKSHKTTLDYENGKLFKVTDPVEEYYYFKYDPNQTTVTSDKGKTISFTFNQDGNITSKTNTLGHQVHFEYNDKMLVEHMYYDNEIDGTIKTLHYHYTYDARGNILTSKDPLGNITEFKNYNDMNQVKDIIKPISNGVLATYHYDYDDYGNLRTSNGPRRQNGIVYARFIW